MALTASQLAAFRQLGALLADIVDPYGPDAEAAFVGGFFGLPPVPAVPANILIGRPGVSPVLAITAFQISDDEAAVTFPIAYDDKFQDTESIPTGTALTVASDDAGAFIQAPTLDPTGVAGIIVTPAGAGKLGVANITLSDGTLTAMLAVTVVAGAKASIVIGAPGST